ncbi:MAG: hypothetical protein CK548_08595 [Opitutia bacterium]|nr:MAG: hypothetical protein CK548_08595 [Opitutae bacterium]
MKVKLSLRVLAEACGVSSATVSRALSGHPTVRAALRGKLKRRRRSSVTGAMSSGEDSWHICVGANAAIHRKPSAHSRAVARAAAVVAGPTAHLGGCDGAGQGAGVSGL